MTDIERIEQRLSAVERTVADGDFDLEDLGEVSELTDDMQALQDRIDEFGERLADLEAEVQALGGYASEVESVNTDVEQQAYAAYATVDRLEDRVRQLEERLETVEDGDGVPSAAAVAADPKETRDAGEPEPDPSSGVAPSTATDEGSDSPDMGPFEPSRVDGTDANGNASTDGGGAAEVDVVESLGANVDEPSDRSEEEAVDDLFESDDDAVEDEGGLFDSLRSKLS